jgi:AcrR family transcriptional regulator
MAANGNAPTALHEPHDGTETLPPAQATALTKAGRVRKRDPERTSAAILDAAVHEFSHRGYDGARVDAIAKRAKINKRMLYHYFGGKDGLYLAVLEGRYAAIRSAETLLDLTHREPIEGMRKLILFTWDYFLEHPEFLSILATENQHKARFLKQSERVVQLNSPLVDALREVLARGIERKIFRSGVDPVELYISIASLGAFYLSNRWTLSTIFRRDLMAQEQLTAWGDHIVDMVLAFLKP